MAKELTPEQLMEAIKERLTMAGLRFTKAELQEYISKPDSLGINEELEVPQGFKRCGRCRHIKKYHLFNKNNSSKEGCSGACKECQKESAKKSYKKTKSKKNYKAYYQANKEKKLAHSKEYYAQNKERLNAQHAKYVQSKKGKEVMKRAREKRALGLANTGIPYTPAQVWERDCMLADAMGYPICYLCGEPMIEQKKCHIDHVVGINIGGLNSFENVAYVHDKCNLTKSKDCREVTTDMSDQIKHLTEVYIAEHEEDFQ